MLKLFSVIYGYESGGRAETIVIANTKSEVRLLCELKDYQEVKGEPNTWRQYQISEVVFEKKIVCESVSCC